MTNSENTELYYYIKEANLRFTKTLTREDFHKQGLKGINLNKTSVNYKNCISLLELVSSFNKSYVSFKKEYDNLTKLDFGKSIELVDYMENNYFDDERILKLGIVAPLKSITNDNYTYLNLIKRYGAIFSYFTNEKNKKAKDYYCKNAEIDYEVIKQYLNLFKEYKQLIEDYYYYKLCNLFSDGAYYIYTKIEEKKYDILNGLNSFKFSIGSSYLGPENSTKLEIKLGEKSDINYKKCKLTLNNEPISASNDDYDKLLSDIYINKSITRSRKII